MDKSDARAERLDGLPGEMPAAVSVFPCSLAQSRFWVLDQIDPGTPALNVAVRWQLDGPIEPGLLERAIQKVIDRHEILRSCFPHDDRGPRQQVLAHVPFRLSIIDLRRLPESDRMAEALRLGAQEAHTGFDLTTAPLLRATLLRLNSLRSILLVTLHHIVSDGWSVGVLARDICVSYRALREGTAAVLPDLPLQYGDFGLWQQAWLASPALEEARSFWADSLQGAKYFEMPSDRPRKQAPSGAGAIASILLPRDLTDAAEARGRTEHATFFMVALTALAGLLQRYAGETDLSIGTQVAGRTDTALEDMVGPFINTLVLRVDASGDPALSALLLRVRKTVLEALSHESMPLEQVIELVKPARDPSRNPLFSVNLILQRAFVENAEYGDIRLTDLPSQSAGALYDLNFFLVERPDGWRASCEYATDLFDPATVQAMLGGWTTLLGAWADGSAAKLSQLPLVDAPTRARLVHEWNATAASYPAETIFPVLFEAQAKRSPGAVAVLHGDRQITYRALDEASNRLARHLHRRGAGVGSLVGIAVERSIDMVVALLATMKAGAAYVPLDPAYPSGRLEQMIGDSRLALLLTDSGARPMLPACEVPVLELDVLAGAILAESASPLEQTAGPGDAAYVIYTSGSTGRPKGVRVPHRALVNLLWSMKTAPGMTAQDVLVAVTTLSFDIAALELFLPLLAGARVAVASREEAADGQALDALLNRCKASVMQATPITWQLLIEAGWDRRMRMLCGGEAMPRKLADQLLARGGTLWNLYGPTETTIWSAAGEVGADGPILIGPPIANTQLHVLSDSLQLLPPGAIGELFIGGDGVADGYLNRPDLTETRFLPDPFRETPGARLYRTGDLARRRADGRIEFLGRADDQIKLRGFRIELGEVEAALLRHDGTASAAASVRDGGAGPSLCAWVVAAPSYAARPGELVRELRRDLASSLPAHMQPATIAVVDALPRTANGKIDRNALRAAEPPPVLAPRAETLPAAQTEQALATIWSEILGVAEVDPEASFFELGGHSLLAARMLARVEAEFGYRLGLSALFRAPTIRTMVPLLPVRDQPQGEIEVIEVQPDGDLIPIFAINNSGVFHTLSKRLGPNQPFISVQLVDIDRPRVLAERTLEEMAADYLALIRSVRPSGPYILLGWCGAGILAYEIAQQLRGAGEEVRLLVIAEAWAPGYPKRLGGLRAKLADFAYRWNWHVTELKSGQTTLARMVIKSRIGRATGLLTLLTRLGWVHLPPEDPYAWFVRDLAGRIAQYDAQPYDGPVLLVHSAEQPRSRFLDAHYGWDDLVRGTKQAWVVHGDHRTIFDDPGAGELAGHITKTLGETQAL